MAFKKNSVIVLLSEIVLFGLQVSQAKAKKAIGDNDYKNGYSSHHMS